MARRTRQAVLESYPRYRHRTEDDMVFVGSDWDLDRGLNTHTLSCHIHMEGYLHSALSGSHWTLNIKKVRSGKKLSRMWEATVHYENVRDEAVLLARGTDKRWQDAIDVLKYAGLARVLRKLGKVYYDRVHWFPIRPFKVVYPWSNPEEPNCRYSPFTFVGNTFDVATDGVGAYFRFEAGKLPYHVRRWIELADGDAYIGDPDPEGWCRLWHREYMGTFDRIHIDDWRARIIAGS